MPIALIGGAKKNLIPLIFGVCLPFPTLADELKIGVRAHSGVDKAVLTWQPTADYLSSKIPKHSFTIVPYIHLPEFTQGVINGEVDFILTNPSSYIEMEVLAGASRILTLVNNRDGGPYTKFGSVIFTRRDRSDINQYSDLKNKKFIAVSEKAFGGWQVPLYELLQNSIVPKKYFAELTFGQGIQENVVFAVRDGLADAGAVRTDMLERLDARKEININDFKILGAKTTGDFPFLHSTQLYPEWVFAKTRLISNKIVNQVLIELLKMDEHDSAALAGHYMGWTAPLDYNRVRELLKKLKVSPYNSPVEFELNDILGFYWFEIALLSITLVFLTIFLMIKIKSNKKHMLLSQELQQYKLNLEETVKERTNQLEQNNNELQTYTYTLAHDLRTPLRGIISFSQILSDEAKQNLVEEQQEFLDRIITAGKRMEALISDTLELASISRRPLELTTVNFTDIAEHIKFTLTSENPNRKSEWSIQPNMHCEGDLKLLDKLILKLFENSWQYSVNQEITKIEFGIDNSTGEVIYYVKDNGIGFDMKFSKTLFKPFYRLHSIDEFSGTGIGLAIAFRIIERHKGRIWAESAPDEGTTLFFTLNLPISDSQSSE